MNKKNDFNNFRFEGLNFFDMSNKYYSMNRINENEEKIVVKVADSHLLKTKFGYALILDFNHVVFLKEWQVNRNFYGNEVILIKEFFSVKEWGEHTDFFTEEENYNFQTWLDAAKEQQKHNTIVKWAK